jgi:hypothetical protein
MLAAYSLPGGLPNSKCRVSLKKFGPLGALMDALMMRRRLDQGIREISDNLKRYVEARRA